MNHTDLGTKIIRYRKANKISQTDFASLMGVKQPSVAAWEAGHSTPHTELLSKITTLLEEDSQQICKNISLTQRLLAHFSIDEIPLLGKIIEKFRG